MRLSPLSGILLATLLVTACGTEGEPTAPDASVGMDASQIDPGLTVDAGVDYPPPPWGIEAGETLKDMSNYGYRTPTTNWTTIRLSDYYDPEGNRGPGGSAYKAMWINVAALWCGACKAEAPMMVDKCRQHRDRGLVCYTAIYENGASRPATRDDVNTWMTDYGIDYPIVLDGLFKWGSYFDRAATPLNMFVDLRTMKIAYKFTGFGEAEVDAAIDELLSR